MVFINIDLGMKYQLDQSSFVKLNQGCNLTNLEEILNIILNMGKYSRAKYLHPFAKLLK